MCPVFSLVLWTLAVAGALDRSDPAGVRSSRSTLETKHGDAHIALIEHEGFASSNREGDVGVAVEFSYDIDGAVQILNAEEASRTTVGRDKIDDRVGVRRAQSLRGTLREQVLVSHVAVNAAIVSRDFDESLVQSRLRIGKLLPVVAVRESVAILQETVASLRTSCPNLTLLGNGELAADLTVGRAGVGRWIKVQTTLLNVVQLDGEY